MARNKRPDQYDLQIAAASVSVWDRYMADLRADPPNVVDRCAVKVGDTVPRPGADPQRVTASYAAPRADNTWVLEYADGSFSMSPWLYPMLLVERAA